jgi:hypothetical protein
MRKNVKSYIQEICDLLEKKRAQLGIVAQAYATLYFRGKVYDVAIDQLNELKNLGAYVLIIEKEGIVEVLKPFADKYGGSLISIFTIFAEFMN